MSKFIKLGLILVVALFLVSPLLYAGKNKAKNGSNVVFNYYLEADGVLVVPPDRPAKMELKVGTGTFPPAFEKKLLGLKAGDKKIITLRPEEAFGPQRPELIRRVAKSSFPPNMNLKEGALLSGSAGQPPLRVVKIFDDSVVLDQNHPFAGKHLTYNIEVNEVQ